MPYTKSPRPYKKEYKNRKPEENILIEWKGRGQDVHMIKKV